MTNDPEDVLRSPTHTQLSVLFEDVLKAVDHVKANKAQLKVVSRDVPLNRLIGWQVEGATGDDVYSLYFSISITALKPEATKFRDVCTTIGRRNMADLLARGINPLTAAEPEQRLP